MKLKVNLRARGQELTAYVKLTSGRQEGCTKGPCGEQGIAYSVAVKSILNDDTKAEETDAAVLREAKRLLKGKLGSRMALCSAHFAEYLERISDINGEMPTEITEL